MPRYIRSKRFWWYVFLYGDVEGSHSSVLVDHVVFWRELVRHVKSKRAI